MNRFASFLIMAFLWTGIYQTQLWIEAERTKNTRNQPLYLPNGQMLDVLSLGYKGAMASFLWLYSIQYAMEEFWGDQKFQWLYHIYDMITDLDPQFEAAYTQGATFLGMIQGKPEKAIELLEKGKRLNPNAWIYPAEQSFYAALHLKDLQTAVRYLEEAEKIPGVPLNIKLRMTGYYRKLGQDGLAFSYWFEQEQHSTDPRMVEVARKMLQNILEYQAIKQPQAALDRWKQIEKATKDPALQQLAKKNIEHLQKSIQP